MVQLGNAALVAVAKSGRQVSVHHSRPIFGVLVTLSYPFAVAPARPRVVLTSRDYWFLFVLYHPPSLPSAFTLLLPLHYLPFLSSGILYIFFNFFFEIQFYVLRSNLCYTVRRMWYCLRRIRLPLVTVINFAVTLAFGILPGSVRGKSVNTCYNEVV